jgi:hypothetical protein
VVKRILFIVQVEPRKKRVFFQKEIGHGGFGKHVTLGHVVDLA